MKDFVYSHEMVLHVMQWLSSLKMNTTTRVQILHKAISISLIQGAEAKFGIF